MKFIGYNFVSILLVVLAGYMVHADKPYWGWVIVAALLCVSTSSSDVKENDGGEKGNDD